MNSVPWFYSSFESSSVTDGTASSNHPEKRSCPQKVLRKPSLREISHANDVVDDNEIVQVSKNKNVSGLQSSLKRDQLMSCPLIDRFPTQSVEQLAVNPRKVDEVRQWMQKKRGQRRGCKLLLLTGPTGSGKTATVQMLCRELKLDLIEWSCSEFYEIFYDTEGEEVVFEESQVRRFSEFLKSADRGSIENPASQKVVLIEQLPNIFFREPSVFHSILQKSVQNSVCMYIFIMSDVDSCWYLNPKRILPGNILAQLHFDLITFNASAPTFLLKALRRISSLLRVTTTASHMKRVAEISNGDIRTAINNLQLCIDVNNKFVDATPLYSSSLVEPYHCLGKLLHAKRNDVANENWEISEEKLNMELRKSHGRIFPPKDNVSEVIDKAGISGDRLALFLHEHEPNFAVSLPSCSHVCNNISLFDSALGRWEIRTDSALSLYEGEVAARSTVFYNNGYNSKSGRGMYLFHKPRWQNEELQLLSKRKEIYSAFPSHTYGELLSLTLPMIRLIQPANVDYSQYKVLSSMSSNTSGAGPIIGIQSRVKHSSSNPLCAETDGIQQFDIEEIDI